MFSADDVKGRPEEGRREHVLQKIDDECSVRCSTVLGLHALGTLYRSRTGQERPCEENYVPGINSFSFGLFALCTHDFPASRFHTLTSCLLSQCVLPYRTDAQSIDLGIVLTSGRT